MEHGTSLPNQDMDMEQGIYIFIILCIHCGFVLCIILYIFFGIVQLCTQKFHAYMKNQHNQMILTGSDSSKTTYTQIILASTLGLIIAAALHLRLKKARNSRIVPLIRVADNGQPVKLERFSHYVGNNCCL